MIYNTVIDGFVGTQPYPSWALNTTTGLWESPVAIPNNNIINGGSVTHSWDEDNREWDENS